jgi:hypothetical protein
MVEDVEDDDGSGRGRGFHSLIASKTEPEGAFNSMRELVFYM